ncbi:MAG: DUF3240 family protein [Rhodocyclaceae bacterium]|nr:DUF3240 family protein [Rhodocyclaceae bacterium]
MAEVLLTLVVPASIAQHVEDFLLEQTEEVAGFTSSQVAGYGKSVSLTAAAEMVGGSAPRIRIQMIGSEAAMRDLLAKIKREWPHARIYCWLQSVIEAGYL